MQENIKKAMLVLLVSSKLHRYRRGEWPTIVPENNQRYSANSNARNTATARITNNLNNLIDRRVKRYIACSSTPSTKQPK